MHALTPVYNRLPPAYSSLSLCCTPYYTGVLPVVTQQVL